jgi:hypothetical protein
MLKRADVGDADERSRVESASFNRPAAFAEAADGVRRIPHGQERADGRSEAQQIGEENREAEAKSWLGVRQYVHPRRAPAYLPESSFERWLIYRNANDTRSHHTERASRADRYVNHHAPE